MNTEQALREAGFTAQADQIKILADRKRRLTLAYEFHRFVTEEKITAFQQKLRISTERQEGEYPYLYATHDTLAFTPIEQWAGQPSAPEQGVPPTDVLNAVKEAKDRAIFDAFEVAHIQTTRVYIDPIVFGRIDGCTDRFFVTQWGSDVSLNDILAEHDG